MKLTIDIKTLAGRSLEGFPREEQTFDEYYTDAGRHFCSHLDSIPDCLENAINETNLMIISPGDVITIKIEKDS